MKKVFLILCVVAMTVAMCVGVAAATMGETEAEAKENDDFAITVSEVDSDGEIKITTNLLQYLEKALALGYEFFTGILIIIIILAVYL